jgi:hypothetical protein
MRIAQGGMQLWCPRCAAVTVCKAVNPSLLGKDPDQSWYMEDHPDIQWFRRARICKTCDQEFLTAEIAEAFLDELIQLRETSDELRKYIQTYAKQSTAELLSLSKKSKSLKVRRGSTLTLPWKA